MKKFTVVYEDGRGGVLPITVFAKDAKDARMVAGMKRGELFELSRSLFPQAYRKLKWSIRSVTAAVREEEEEE